MEMVMTPTAAAVAGRRIAVLEMSMIVAACRRVQ
jgi:hypothetical protein